MKQSVWKRCSAAAAAVLMAAALPGCAGAKGDVAFTVNGLEVEKDELVYYMKRNTSVVAAELEETYSLDSTTEDFWTTEVDGIVPFDYLTEYTVEEITRTKVEQLCAKEYGIDTPLYYSQQLTEQKRQNEERLKAEAAGEILYGPTERDFVAYFAELYLGMKEELETKLSEDNQIRVTPEEVEEYYYVNASRLTGTLEENQGAIYTELMDTAYENFFDEKAQQAVVEMTDTAVSVDEVV